MQRAAAIRVLSLFLLLGGLATPAAGEGEVRDEDWELEQDYHRWVLGVSLGFDVLMQDVAGALDTSFEGRVDGNPDIGVRGAGSAFFANPMFGGDVDVTAPSWTNLPGRPRLYLGVGARYALKIPHTIASSGDKPSEIPPEDQWFAFETFRNGPRDPLRFTYINGKVNPLCDKCEAGGVPGQGVSLKAEAGHLYWQAEIGLAFAIPVGSRTLLLKPAVGYYQQELRMDGKAHRVYRNEASPLREYSIVELDTVVEDTFHSLGPKIRAELDVLRFSQIGQRFGASVFADFGVYWMLGDRSTNALVVEQPPYAKPPLFNQPQRAEYRMEVNQLSYRLGVGVRFSWYPRYPR